MNLFTEDQLHELTAPKENWCISIFMPTFEKSQEVRQNPIRFKNLLQQAEAELSKMDLEAGEIETILAPAWKVHDDFHLWQHQGKGFAAFLSGDFFQTHQLPVEVEETVIVSDRFYLKPLLPLLYGEDEFFILALSKNATRFLKASEHSVERLDIPNLPADIDEALPDVSSEKHIQWHSGTAEPGGKAQGAGERPAMFFGHGQGEEDRDKKLLNYFRQVDAAITAYLKDNKAPLVLAGVKYILPIYKEATNYQHLVDDILPGNPDDKRDEELRDEAWERINHLFQSTQVNTAGQYRQLSGSSDSRAVKDLKEVVKAAPFGRVEVLFVDKNAKQWGKFDENNVEVMLQDEQTPGSQDLLDFAAVQTLLHGGTVYAVDSDQLPQEGTPVAAIFRY